jgi:O-antigen ligase
MFALLVGGVALVLISLCRTERARMGVAWLALFVGFGASLHFLFRKYSGSTDSYRGYLWEMASDSIRQAPIFGHGPSYWWVLNDRALFQANYSPHNGWLDMLVGVGVWGVILIVAGVAVQFFTTSRTALPWLITYYATVLTIDMLESVYIPYYFGILPFAAIMPLMVYEPKKPKDPELEENLSAVQYVPSDETLADETPSVTTAR